jgi:hypothetical protein
MINNGGMLELVDKMVLKTIEQYVRVGSTPIPATKSLAVLSQINKGGFGFPTSRT